MSKKYLTGYLFLCILRNVKRIRTEKIGKEVKMLIKEGFVKVRGNIISITKSGEKFCEEIIELLNSAYWSEISIRGKVVKGCGKGKHFMSIDEYKKQFSKLFGIEPFEGTLNVKVEKKYEPVIKVLKLLDMKTIKGFKKDGKRFGDVKFIDAVINEKVFGGVIFPKKSRYGDDIIEIVSPVNLREFFELKNGDKIEVKIVVSD